MDECEQMGKNPYEFMMGTADAEEGEKQVGLRDERPRHPVRLTPFALMDFPVTRRQFRMFDDGRLEGTYEESVSERSPDDDCPMIVVSWFDAWCFARWLGTEYRLPTEAEWEYACRAGKDGSRDYFHFGDSLSSQQANFHGNYPFPDGATKGEHLKRTTPRKKYDPNVWKLYDMHGNVREWCADWYDADYYARLLGKDPLRPSTGSIRVLRGGSWWLVARLCRSAYPIRIWPGFRLGFRGFRVARSPSGK